jgi:uncharacterized membrane protein
MGAQSTIGAAVSLVLAILMIVPVINVLIAILLYIYDIALFIMIIIAMVKTSKGERFDFPVISKYALKLMGSI